MDIIDVHKERRKGPYLNYISKMFWFLPLSAFSTDVQFGIHTTFLTSFSFWFPNFVAYAW